MSTTTRYDIQAEGADASPNFKVTLIPLTGPNAGVGYELQTASEKSWEPGIAADHIMGTDGKPVAVVRTELKPGGSIGALMPGEKDAAILYVGGQDAHFNMQWVISGPGVKTKEYDFRDCIVSGGAGTEANIGSVPSSGLDIICVSIYKNGKVLFGREVGK